MADVSSNYYSVQKGDILAKIAKANGTTVEELKRLNQWINDVNCIFPKQAIKIADENSENVTGLHVEHVYFENITNDEEFKEVSEFVENLPSSQEDEE